MIRLTEEQIMLRQMTRELALEKFAPRAAEIDQTGEFPWDNVKLLADYELLGINVPEEYGGAGSDTLSHAIAIEEVARVCGSTSVILTTQALAIAPVFLAGTDEQKKKYLTPMASGKVLGAFGLTEPGAGSDASRISTTAARDGDYYVLNGVKHFITNGGEAEIYTIVAMTDKSKGVKGISTFFVEKGTPGFTFGKKESKMGIRGSTTRELIFENCRIPKENLLGREGEGFKIVMKSIDHTRTGVAAQALGIAQGALDAALEYSKQREQFGQPICEFQGIQFMLADMATQIEAARALVYQSAVAIDDHAEDLSKISAMAKLFASDTAMKVTTDAVQIFGGYGYSTEYPVERYMRDAKITQIYEGTNQIQRIVIARSLIKQ
ncbi:MAG: acyl-CoA dehydrogenase [Peptococcaceae bacterium BRH_c4b]|nr:MAG: acyl-CoA dehydrogenase [Peptococcaceae bacterium BRH_c4b]